jgi:hypothetical protein
MHAERAFVEASGTSLRQAAGLDARHAGGKWRYANS